MGLFGKGHAAPSAEERALRDEVNRLRGEVATMQAEWRAMREAVHDEMDRAYRHRKAAEAERRRATEAASANQGRPNGDADTPPQRESVALRRSKLWGARARRMARAVNGQDEPAAPEPEA